ncbi:DUF883 family protein [Kumtagia ephedrae]|uniref:DUF883 domain-containing protein n=1 Tax=Kumtagia ephedrae TaxID=2116701 RepID=A0A2P7SLY3_9HYPH|nr:DUF883 family protein [Mesorhizobium ephedrae]PSJ63421.1 hypothetical protein C7I84_07270 [Mesorhizobium ephedrae]
MATAAKAAEDIAEDAARPDLEADIRQLRQDIAKLAEQLTKTGQHSYGTARRAAAEGAEQLRAQGEAAIQNLKSNARDLEDQLTTTVREKPITSLAIAAGVGYLLALLSRR